MVDMQFTFELISLGKVWSSLSPGYGFNSITVVLLQGWILHKITQEGWYAIKQKNNKTKPIYIYKMNNGYEIKC